MLKNEVLAIMGFDCSDLVLFSNQYYRWLMVGCFALIDGANSKGNF